MADKLEVMSCDITEIKATLEQIVGILDRNKERNLENLTKSFER